MANCHPFKVTITVLVGYLIILIFASKRNTSFPWTVNMSHNVSVYIQPDSITTLLQPHDVCQADKDSHNIPFILFMIPSAVKNSKQRDIIRQTWGLWSDSYKRLEDGFVQQNHHLNFEIVKPKMTSPQ